MRNTIIILLISLMVGVCGVWMGKAWVFSDNSQEPDLHTQIHRSLELSQSQLAKIHVLEEEFADRKNELEDKLKAANGSLADAIQKDHKLSANVRLAGEQYLQILGELQIATLDHIFKMRAVLDEKQAEQFDQIVTRSLHAATR